MRDSLGYEGNILGQLYRGDEVKRLDADKSAWWRVEIRRTGQTGWVRKELLSATPVSPVFYYVSEDSLPLLECPASDCHPLQLLFRGDEVQRVEEGKQGWWRVLAVKSRILGWAPSASLAARLEEAQARPPGKLYYYVAVRRLSLRAQPSTQAGVIRTLRFNDQVQKLEEKHPGWFKVRQPSSGAVGWVPGRNLQPQPLISPPGGSPAKKGLKPFKPREEPQLEPEFM
ncbi:MAG: hypothetical protein FJ134_11465 [Deltaproteobacteria bacterium]|nr:hypothetical protein [Deltaproteobacteria bacterium]